ncbi:MAG: FtsX-like permease family protein, partial [Paramuribaculum sp.]|nr:FtsX-like permease family protein [Paramuribaculum sp.]
FIAGKPGDRADKMSDLRKVVITESVARQAFASDGKEAVGRTLLINDEPWEVAGVVADVSPVTDVAYAQIWIPVSLTAPTWGNPNMGDMRTLIVPRPGRDEAVKAEVNRRLAVINTRLAADSCTLAIAGAPYDHEHQKADEYPNSLPDVDKGRRERWMLFGILLLIPAINLSSMTRSRLRRRVSEIGIRRAFGCTRMRIVGDILVENMVITLIGGVIGLLLCIGFGALLFDTVYSIGRWNQFAMPATLSAEALFDWSIGAYALLFCFILNLISTGVPALRASRINPVEAINQNK